LPDDDRRTGRQSSGPRRPYPPARPGAGRRAAAVPPALLQDTAWQRRFAEFLMPASVILAGVLLVVAFGFIINRAMRDDDGAGAIPVPQPPALGDVPLEPSDQGIIPLPSAPAPESSRPPTTPPAKKTKPPADHDVDLDRQSVASVVDLSAEGRRDWVHWGQEGTFSLERAAAGDFQILEGAPTAPRFRHALSPQRFRWQGGAPVDSSDGTTTGIRTCDKGNGFTISAPAAKSSRVLRLYVGAFAARGRLEVKLSTGGSTEVGKLEQRDNSLATAVFVVTYRAPRDGTLKLNWVTEETFGGEECRGVALQGATLR
jgi:hypothetical protein